MKKCIMVLTLAGVFLAAQIQPVALAQDQTEIKSKAETAKEKAEAKA